MFLSAKMLEVIYFVWNSPNLRSLRLTKTSEKRRGNQILLNFEWLIKTIRITFLLFILVLFQHQVSRGRDIFNPLSANPTKWSNTLKPVYATCWFLSLYYLLLLATKSSQFLEIDEAPSLYGYISVFFWEGLMKIVSFIIFRYFFGFLEVKKLW